MALTNLASLDHEFRNFLVARRVVHTLTYLQFSEHELVQQAATECLCNLIAHPDVAFGVINGGDRLKLQVALCECYDEQPRTASAAAGLLATLTQLHGEEVWVAGKPSTAPSSADGDSAGEIAGTGGDKDAGDEPQDVDGRVEVLECVEKLTELDCASVMVELAGTDDQGLQHRAVATMEAMANASGSVGEAACVSLVKAGAKRVLQQLQGSPVPPIATGARSLVRQLKKVKVDANDYSRFEEVGEEDGDGAASEQQQQMRRNIEMLAEKLTEEEQTKIMAGETPEEQARLLQEAIEAHPEWLDEAVTEDDAEDK